MGPGSGFYYCETGFTVSLYSSNLPIQINGICPDPCDGDLNNDMIVNVLDIITIVNCIVSDDICDDCYDISGDGIINIIDIISIVNIIIND